MSFDLGFFVLAILAIVVYSAAMLIKRDDS